MIPSCSSFGSVAQLQHINKIQKQIEQLNDANLNDLYFHGNYHIHSHPCMRLGFCFYVFVSLFIDITWKKEKLSDGFISFIGVLISTHTLGGLSQDTHWPISCNTSMFLTHNFLFIILHHRKWNYIEITQLQSCYV